MTTREDTTAAATFTAFSHRDDWLGFGYLGERRNKLEDGIPADLVASVDAWIVATTTGADWTTEDLFTWANSKDGRWFADMVYGGTGHLDTLLQSASRYLRKQAN